MRTKEDTLNDLLNHYKKHLFFYVSSLKIMSSRYFISQFFVSLFILLSISASLFYLLLPFSNSKIQFSKGFLDVWLYLFKTFFFTTKKKLPLLGYQSWKIYNIYIKSNSLPRLRRLLPRFCPLHPPDLFLFYREVATWLIRTRLVQREKRY